MKDEFFAGLFDQARKIANDLLDKAESALYDLDKDMRRNEDIELEDLRLAVDQLETQNDELNETIENLTGVIQVLLDGEVRKDLSVSWEKYNNLRNATLEVTLTDDTEGTLSINVSQK